MILKRVIAPHELRRTRFFCVIARLIVFGTAKKDHVELFRVTSGKKKTENALNLLNKALHNIDKGKHMKNRASCQSPFGMCEFFKSEHCS